MYYNSFVQDKIPETEIRLTESYIHKDSDVKKRGREKIETIKPNANTAIRERHPDKTVEEK